MWGNLLKGFKFFPCLPQLRELNASCNRITGQLARLVARAPKLEVVKLALNPISEEAELMPLVSNMWPWCDCYCRHDS